MLKRESYIGINIINSRVGHKFIKPNQAEFNVFWCVYQALLVAIYILNVDTAILVVFVFKNSKLILVNMVGFFFTILQRKIPMVGY